MGMCSDGNCPECQAARAKRESDAEKSDLDRNYDRMAEAFRGEAQLLAIGRKVDELILKDRNERREKWLTSFEKI